MYILKNPWEFLRIIANNYSKELFRRIISNDCPESLSERTIWENIFQLALQNHSSEELFLGMLLKDSSEWLFMIIVGNNTPEQSLRAPRDHFEWSFLTIVHNNCPEELSWTILPSNKVTIVVHKNHSEESWRGLLRRRPFRPQNRPLDQENNCAFVGQTGHWL